MQRLIRIEIGALIGAGMGLLYSLFSQLMNPLVLRPINLYSTSPRPWLTVLLIILAAALLGVLTGIHPNMIYGALVGGAAAAVLQTLRAFLVADALSGFIPVINTFLTAFIPSFLLFSLLGLLLRWVVSRLAEGYFSANRLTWPRFYPLLVALGVAALFGGFSLYRADYRHDLRLVDAYLQEGARALTAANLPQALRDIPGYFSYSDQPYSLEPSRDISLYAGQPPEGIPESEKGIVLVHFQDGFTLTCLTVDRDDSVICEQYVPLDQRESADQP